MRWVVALNALAWLWRPVWWWLLLATVLTGVLAHPGVRYVPLGEVPLWPQTPQARLLSAPDVVPLAGGFALVADDASAYRGLGWTLAVPDGATHLRVRARLLWQDVSQGEKVWQRASVNVRQSAADGGHRERALFNDGDSGALALDEVLPLEPGTATVQVLVRLLRATGELQVRGLRASWGVERGWIAPAMGATGVVWALAFVGLAARWWPRSRAGLGLLGALGLALALVLMPGWMRDGALRMLVGWSGNPSLAALGGALSGYTHLVMFAVLGLAMVLARPTWPWWRTVLELCVLAAASEWVQLLVPGRSADWSDAGMDLVGLMLGACVGVMLSCSRRVLASVG